MKNKIAIIDHYKTKYTVEHYYSAPANKACPLIRDLTYSPLRGFVVFSMLAMRQLLHKA